jgi:hypothetical protein
MPAADCYQLLAVQPGAAPDDVLAAYHQLSRPSAEQRRAAKILSDPYYRQTYNVYRSLRAVVEAGWFDDGTEPGPSPWLESLAMATTPVDRLTLSDERQTVLVMMGALSPLHNGHIEAMERSRAALEERGQVVAGGYFSLAHDGYVSTKYDGSAAMAIERRTLLAQASVAESEWLMVDPFEGSWTAGPITLSEVMTRLDAYLSHYLKSFDICAVVGSDNAAFARAFVAAGQCCLVERTGTEKKIAALLAEPELQPALGRIHPVGNSTQAHLSSRAWRAGTAGPGALPKRAEQALQRLDQPRSGRYALRDDLAWASEHWVLDQQALDHFRQQVITIITQALPAEVEVVTIDLAANNAGLTRCRAE